jgi:hypothetical protein
VRNGILPQDLGTFLLRCGYPTGQRIGNGDLCRSHGFIRQITELQAQRELSHGLGQVYRFRAAIFTKPGPVHRTFSLSLAAA